MSVINVLIEFIYWHVLFLEISNERCKFFLFLVEIRTAILETNCVALRYYIFGMSYYYIFYLLLANVVKKKNKTIECMFQTTTKVKRCQ